MVLRSQVEWALHCCAVLAGLGPGETVSTRTLSELHGVPKEYLSKALQALAGAGLVVGTLGPTGGYRLAKPTKEITFLQIVEAIEGKKSSFNCTEIRANNPVYKQTGKRPKGVCSIARIMFRADEAWRRELRTTTLADLDELLRQDVSAETLARTAEWLASQR